MTDFAQFKIGAVAYPITAVTTNSALQDVDPPVYYSLEFFESVLNTYMGPRLLAEADRPPAIAVITAAVAGKLALDPVPHLQDQHLKFPLLAIYRKREVFQQTSLSVTTIVSTWGVDYIMPPMTGGQMERMFPFLHAVGQILCNRIENVSDPDYEDGLAVWETAGINNIKIEEAVLGSFGGTGNLIFPAWRATITVTESDTLTGTGSADEGLEDLAGVDAREDVVGTLPADGTTEINFLNLVGAGIQISPLSATVIAGDTETFTSAGGSGTTVVFSLITNNSGGSIHPTTGVYTAGATSGVYDVVSVRDSMSPTPTIALVSVI